MKKVHKKSLFAATLAATLLISTACGDTKKTGTEESDIDLSSYPIKTDVTLSYFTPLRSSLAGMVENYSETSFAQEFEKRTGVKIDYIHSAIGQEKEMLSLLIASNELPDIMHGNWIGYQGGVSSAIEDNIIIDIADYKEYAPAYFKKIESNPEWDKAAKSDDGQYYGFQFISGSPRLRMVTGPVVRADWLRELNLEYPETINEWETVLTAFRDKKGATAPFSTASRANALCMFGVQNGLYVDGDVYKHGYAEPEMKRALTVMNDWFNKGLLDKNYISVDSKMLDSQVLSGQTGAMVITGGDIQRYMNAANSPEFELVGIKYPTYKKGTINTSMNVGLPITGTSVSAISGQCKHPALAAKVLDYLYTEEGSIFANFGVEGETYEMVNNEPKYTDLIMKNPEGLSIMESLGLYVRAGETGPFENLEGYINQYYETPQQQAALNSWQIGFAESEQHKTRPVTLTTEEAQEASDLLAEIGSYLTPMISKFITGAEPIEKFDAFVEELYDLGLQRVLDIYTEALARYNSR